jgi:CubicO group peptidase (beta-lactamase class C family)
MNRLRQRWHARSFASVILVGVVFATVPTPANSDAGATGIQDREPISRNTRNFTFRVEPKTTPSVSDIDDAVKQVMERGHVRGAALAIVQGTHLVYTKGYTLAEPGYSDVRPVTYFRQASVSKMVTALAVYQLLQENKLPNGLDTTLQSILHLKLPPKRVDGNQPQPGEILKPGRNPRPANTSDPRFGSITLRHLLEMSSGLDMDLDWADLQTAAAFGSSLPVSPEQLASYCASEKLWATPGDRARQAYNNTGYLMLSLAVAKLRNAPSFVEAIGPTLLRPLSIRRVRESRSLLSAQLPDEAHYDADSPETDPSVMTQDRPAVPLGYGTENIQNFLGGGGLSAAVTDMARLLAALSMKNSPILSNDTRLLMLDNAAKCNDLHAVTDQFGNKDTTHGCHGFDAVTKMGDGVYSGQKGGYLVTSQSSIYFETNGISFAVAWNSHTTKPGGPTNEQWYPNFQPVLDAARKHDWGKTDLFPMYGMPALGDVEINRSVIQAATRDGAEPLTPRSAP